MRKKVLENHQIFLERIEVFKKFGIDRNKEKEFILNNSLPIKGNILEIGTGKGHFTLALAKQGYSFTSVDISKEDQALAKLNLEYFKVKEKVNFKIANAENLGFNDSSFDVIFSVNTIHHLSNPYKAIAEMIRLVLPGGKIILSDFNKNGFSILDQIHKAEGRNHNKSFVTLKDLRDYLMRRGFWVREIKGENQDLIISDKH
ncbi:MAG: class I SAM-dependent methyltransferase [Candidatus Omnitrophota bacterium]